jgi:hypothetical protein
MAGRSDAELGAGCCHRPGLHQGLQDRQVRSPCTSRADVQREEPGAAQVQGGAQSREEGKKQASQGERVCQPAARSRDTADHHRSCCHRQRQRQRAGSGGGRGEPAARRRRWRGGRWRGHGGAAWHLLRGAQHLQRGRGSGVGSATHPTGLGRGPVAGGRHSSATPRAVRGGVSILCAVHFD